ncbi:MAG: hypothetical protein WC404_02490, partial [Candidatus Omnitrophota bacterium]
PILYAAFSSRLLRMKAKAKNDISAVEPPLAPPADTPAPGDEGNARQVAKQPKLGRVMIVIAGIIGLGLVIYYAGSFILSTPLIAVSVILSLTIVIGTTIYTLTKWGIAPPWEGL